MVFLFLIKDKKDILMNHFNLYENNKNEWFYYIKQNNLNEVIKLLIKGFDVNFKDGYGMSAIHYSCMNNDFKLFKLLIKKGASLLLADNEGNSCLIHQIRYHQNIKLARFIIDLLPDINIKHNYNKSNFLHYAAMYGHLDICQYLIEKKIKINEQNIDGDTPLHLAAQYQHLNVCKYLIEKNVSLNIKNNLQATFYNQLHDNYKKEIDFFIKKRNSLISLDLI